ncbi:hypothetical protein D8B46_04340 [Candidatus Gracilibacteria bacterium]|nr:MAG: hypothetical protein D8B46_04340 [Candidatus Gracilibacteria bacterium]
MCRILFLKGKNKERTLEYLDAFTKSGTCDKRFEKLTQNLNIKGLKDQHIHGWGYLLVSSKNVSTYLTSEFIKNDEVGMEKLKTEIKNISGEFVLFAEIRVTDKGYVSAFNSHPFSFSTRNGIEGFLFHNGFLDGDIVAKSIGVNPEFYKTKNSSTFIGLSISQKLEQGITLPEALFLPDQSIKTTYNLMLFIHDNFGKYKAYIYPHIKKSALGIDYICDCNKLLRKNYEDLIYIGSSTISDYIHEEFETVENNKLLEFEINFVEEYYFDGE